MGAGDGGGVCGALCCALCVPAAMPASGAPAMPHECGRASVGPACTHAGSAIQQINPNKSRLSLTPPGAHARHGCECSSGHGHACSKDTRRASAARHGRDAAQQLCPTLPRRPGEGGAALSQGAHAVAAVAGGCRRTEGAPGAVSVAAPAGRRATLCRLRACTARHSASTSSAMFTTSAWSACLCKAMAKDFGARSARSMWYSRTRRH